METKYTDVSDDTKKVFNTLLKKMNQPFVLQFQLLHYEKLKTAVKIQKVSDVYQHLCQKDILILFNEEIFEKMDANAQEIILLQELDKISVNIDSGKVKLIKPDVVTFSGILKKYGLEKVARANQLNDLVQEGNVLQETETFFEK